MVLLAWQVYAAGARGLLIPTVPEVLGGLGATVQDPRVWLAFGRSNAAMVIGYVAAVGVGVPLGLMIGRVKLADQLVSPYLGILLAAPIAAISPLLLIALGLTIWSQVVLVFVFAIVMIVVNCRAGVRQCDPVLLEMGRSFLAGELSLWRHILLRAALPGIMAGLQLGLGRAIQGMVVGELLLVATGIGGLILDFSGRYMAGELYAVVILVILEALLLSTLLQYMERRLVPWARLRGSVQRGRLVRSVPS